jgi:hypothetical protein
MHLAANPQGIPFACFTPNILLERHRFKNMLLNPKLTDKTFSLQWMLKGRRH